MKHLTILFLFICSVAFGQSKTCVKFDKFFDHDTERTLLLDVEICSLNQGDYFTIKGEKFKTVERHIMDGDPVYTVTDKNGHEYFLGVHKDRKITFYHLNTKKLIMFYE